MIVEYENEKPRMRSYFISSDYSSLEFRGILREKIVESGRWENYSERRSRKIACPIRGEEKRKEALQNPRICHATSFSVMKKA